MLLSKRHLIDKEIEEVDFSRLSITESHQRKSKLHYYRDSNHFTPLKEVKISFESKDINYFSVMFDSRTSACINQTADKIYHKNGLRYFRLVRNSENNYLIARNTDGLLSVPEGKYEFIITNDNNVFEMRIGNMPHFYLNGKRHNHLVVAGEIFFKAIDGAAIITEINDKSGGYHVKDSDNFIFKLKQGSMCKAIEKVGLPLDKFIFVYSKSQPANYFSNMSRLECISYLRNLSPIQIDIKKAQTIAQRTSAKIISKSL